MWGNDTVHPKYIAMLTVFLIVMYALWLDGWGKRIEWLQSISNSDYHVLEE